MGLLIEEKQHCKAKTALDVQHIAHKMHVILCLLGEHTIDT